MEKIRKTIQGGGVKGRLLIVPRKNVDIMSRFLASHYQIIHSGPVIK